MNNVGLLQPAAVTLYEYYSMGEFRYSLLVKRSS
uniref:Uncharacterized protein n=1 Tax=Anguilla anguilla TaxID=7936 RepID=A0A0E9T2V7_ANGAN